MAKNNLQQFKKRQTKSKTDGMNRKEWVSVFSPEILFRKKIAETTVNKENKKKELDKDIKNRVFCINLADLEPSGELDFSKIKLKVTEREKNILNTKFYGFDTTRDKIASVIRKWHTLIETNVDLKTSDNYFLRIFIIGFTKKPKGQNKKYTYLKSSQRRSITRLIKEVILKNATENTVKGILDQIMLGTIAGQILSLSSKIHSLQNVLIHKIKVLEK